MIRTRLLVRSGWAVTSQDGAGAAVRELLEPLQRLINATRTL